MGPPAAALGRKKDTSSSSEESDSEDEEPAKAPAASEFMNTNICLLLHKWLTPDECNYFGLP